MVEVFMSVENCGKPYWLVSKEDNVKFYIKFYRNLFCLYFGFYNYIIVNSQRTIYRIYGCYLQGYMDAINYLWVYVVYL